MRRIFNTLLATTFTIMSYVYSMCHSGNLKVKKKVLNIVRTLLGLVHVCQLQLHCLNLLLTLFGILELASVIHDLSSGSSPTIYPFVDESNKQFTYYPTSWPIEKKYLSYRVTNVLLSLHSLIKLYLYL